MHICLAIFYVQCDAKLSDFHVHMAICCASASYRYKHRKTFFFMFFNHVFFIDDVVVAFVGCGWSSVGVLLIFFFFSPIFLFILHKCYANAWSNNITHIYTHIARHTHLSSSSPALSSCIFILCAHNMCHTHFDTLTVNYYWWCVFTTHIIISLNASDAVKAKKANPHAHTYTSLTFSSFYLKFQKKKQHRRRNNSKVCIQCGRLCIAFTTRH